MNPVSQFPAARFELAVEDRQFIGLRGGFWPPPDLSASPVAAKTTKALNLTIPPTVMCSRVVSTRRPSALLLSWLKRTFSLSLVAGYKAIGQETRAAEI